MARKIIVAAILIFSITSLLVVSFSVSFSHLPITSGERTGYEGLIHVTVDGKDRGYKDIPVYAGDMEPFSHVDLSFRLPSDVSNGDVLTVRKGFSKFDVFVDGDLVYSFYPEARESGRPDYGYGSFFFMDLPDNSAGKLVEIKSIKMASNRIVDLNDIYYGDGGTLELAAIFSDFTPIIISYIIGFMAFVALIVAFKAREKDTRDALLSSAILFIAISSWIYCQSRSRQYLMPNIVLPSSICNTVIYFFPYVLFYYFISNYPIRDKKKLTILKYFSFIFILGYAVIGVLQAIGIYSFEEALPLTTTVLIAYVAAFILSVLYEFFVKKEKVGSFLIIISLMSLSFLMEWVLVLIGRNIRSSIILYVLACSVVFVLIRCLSLFLFQSEERQMKDALLSFAFRDSLTGVRNRQNYESLIASSWYTRGYVDVYLVDANMLKKINDEFGHSEGDKLLKDVAKVLIETFPLFKQQCYRLGGDEFLVISPASITGAPEDNAVKIHERLSEIGRPHSVAIGYVTVNTRKVRIEEAVAMADKRMYENKKKMEKM